SIALMLPTFFLSLISPHPTSTLFPYTTLFRSKEQFLFNSFLKLLTSWGKHSEEIKGSSLDEKQVARVLQLLAKYDVLTEIAAIRSEEHTSELQSRGHLVCRLLLEKKNKK